MCSLVSLKYYSYSEEKEIWKSLVAEFVTDMATHTLDGTVPIERQTDKKTMLQVTSGTIISSK